MKTWLITSLALLTLLNNSIQAAQSAAMRMYCLSIKFNHASSGGPNAIYSLDLTGIDAGINGELFPISDTPPTHAAYLVLTDLFDDEYSGSMTLDVPTTDNNGDGFPDIFDTSQTFNGSSSGTYSFPGFASGNVTASWGRDAGSADGSVRLRFQNFGDFFHVFTILEYKGPLTYTPGTSVVSGTVNLARTGAPELELHGPMTFTKTTTDPHNELAFASGEWTNNVPETYSFYSSPLYRDLNLKTNYYGSFEFDDGDINTGEADYYFWGVSIDDVHDADSDGIPDFSDDPQIISVRPPLLSLNRAPGDLSLTISGNVGQLCEIQEASTVNAATWPTILSVTLTNDPQTVSLPLPATETRFWRVHTP